LGGGASGLYTRSMPKSDSEAAVSERHMSLEKNKKEIGRIGRERFGEGPRNAREDDLRFQSNIQSCRACNVCEGAVKQQNSGVPILISKSRH
jgi:hypothetical protein